jgi:hypothetical protein
MCCVCDALVVPGQHAGGQGFVKRGRGRVLGREQRVVLKTKRPADAEHRIQGMDAMLATGRVGRRAQVQDGRLVGQRHEAVPESLGEKHRMPGRVVQPYRFPLAEPRRAGAQVHHHIEHRPGDTGHVLRLPGRNVRVVNPADHPAPGHRSVHLRDVKLVPQVSRELGTPERFQETSPLIVVHLGREHPGALDAKRLHRMIV